MILNYNFENFMSFRECVEFSMLAPGTEEKNRFPNHYVPVGEECGILKTAVIVGENAGGKSNFVESLRYLKFLFMENGHVRAYRDTVHANNLRGVCRKKEDTHQSFELELWLDGESFYLYRLELDFAGIVKEELSCKKQYHHEYQLLMGAAREKCVLGCEQDGCQSLEEGQCKTEAEVRYALEVPGFEEELGEAVKKAMNGKRQLGLFLTKLAILGNEHAIKFTEWVAGSLFPETNVLNYDFYQAVKNEEEDFWILNDPRFLEIFRMVDSSIIGIDLNKDHPFSKSMIRRRKEDGGIFLRELGKDSSGAREFFAWAVQIFKVVYCNKAVFADEMDRVLNPVLSDRVIAFIHGKQHHGQFIFTTHNVLHLDLRNYMKEQIYFISKDVGSLESELYSLADFPEIQYETTKIYEFYMKGILGGTAVE